MIRRILRALFGRRWHRRYMEQHHSYFQSGRTIR